jgi:hypothetical protein
MAMVVFCQCFNNVLSWIVSLTRLKIFDVLQNFFNLRIKLTSYKLVLLDTITHATVQLTKIDLKNVGG